MLLIDFCILFVSCRNTSAGTVHTDVFGSRRRYHGASSEQSLLFAEGVCAVPSHNGAITVSSNHNSCSVTTYVNSAASDATDVTGRHLSDIKPSLPL